MVDRMHSPSPSSSASSIDLLCKPNLYKFIRRMLPKVYRISIAMTFSGSQIKATNDKGMCNRGLLMCYSVNRDIFCGLSFKLHRKQTEYLIDVIVGHNGRQIVHMMTFMLQLAMLVE